MPPTGSTEFNDWTVTLLTPLPAWAVVLILLGLGLAVVSAHLGLRGEPRRGRRILLTSLRTVAAVAAAFLLVEPAVQLLQVRRVKNRVAVLLDTSRSMGLPAGDGTETRLEQAQSLLRGDAAFFERLGDRFVFEHAAFDRTPRPSDLGRLVALTEATGSRTDLLAAVRAASAGGGGRRLAGVILLSDGGDTEGLAGGLPPEVRTELEALGAPIHVFVAGEEDSVRDLAVARVYADDFAFVRNAIEVEAVIRSRGLPAQELPVVLRREGRVVSSQTVRIEPGSETRVKFRFTPDTTGKFIYTVSVPIVSGEAVSSNNEHAFVLKVIRDRIRVLQVAGRPSWDERFLRGLLKKDPNVDLISFFILRTPTDATDVSQSELSLIPFPTTQLFTQELKTFDLVIFQNFDYLPYQMARYLSNVSAYVKDGGSFVMIGGEKSFSEGRYQGTYIEDILPVRIAARGMATLDTEHFAPRLTDEGRRHPVTQLGGTGEGTDEALSRLPELAGLNLVHSLKPGAQSLLAHPFLKVATGPAPVVSVAEIGRGRTMAVMSDSTWFWSFPAAGAGGDRRVYDRFWSNALRWLIRDPDLTKVHVRPTQDVYDPGEKATLEITVRDREYGPGTGAAVKVEVYGADGRRAGVFETTAGDDGTATVELTPSETGAYKLVAEAFAPSGEAESLGREEGAFLVRATAAEMVDPAPRPELLRAVAEASGGTFERLPRRTFPELELHDPEVVEVGRKRNLDLWDSWLWILVLIGAAATEWALRRRWGHL